MCNTKHVIHAKPFKDEKNIELQKIIFILIKILGLIILFLIMLYLFLFWGILGFIIVILLVIFLLMMVMGAPLWVNH